MLLLLLLLVSAEVQFLHNTSEIDALALCRGPGIHVSDVPGGYKPRVIKSAFLSLTVYTRAQCVRHITSVSCRAFLC